MYLANQGSNTLSGFAVGASALTAVATAPYALTSGLMPYSVEVTRANTFVYVGGVGGIDCYTIGTGGVLTANTAGDIVALADFVSMATSPDGQWLLGLDSLTNAIYVYGINASTGVLTLTNQTANPVLGSSTVSAKTLRVSPSGTLLITSLGTSGDEVFTFNTTTGVPTATGTLTLTATYSDNAATFDANSAYVYIARQSTTSGNSLVASYSVSALGVLTSVSTTPTGNAPYAVQLDSTGDFLYTANRGDATISGYSVANGVMTALTSSPFASGVTVTSLARDNGKKYLLAAALGGSSDLTMYSFDALTSGKLDPVATIANGSGSTGTYAIAATH